MVLSIAIAMFFLVGSAQASTCPGTNVIEDPEAFQWTNQGGYFSGTLEFGEASFTIGGESLTTRAYRQEGGSFSIPGPTMYMTPGETYVLTFKNTLDFEEPSHDENEFKDPNISNIHTHGLHVSGETPADDVTRVINGGFCGDYVYEIPSDHMGGSLWYHPHHHGSAFLQVSGGAFGLLIIDDSGDGIPETVAGMTERQVAVAFLDTDAAGTGGDRLLSGTLDPTWTVNGKIQGNLCMPANEWQHWRLLLADPDAKLKEVSVGSECEVALLARDGVWRTVAPKDLSSNSLDLTGASRADLAVRCSADSIIKVDNKIVAYVFADSSLTPNTLVGPYDEGGSTWSAIRPNYLRDLRSITGPINEQEITISSRTLNRKPFNAEIPTFSISAEGIQEWTIKDSLRHPFHLHVYHMQMNGVCGSDDAFEDGEYYDTVAGSGWRGCLARFDTDPATTSVYEGRTIMHCHILEHEDQGAMGWADVIGGYPPPAFPDPATQNALYQCDGPTTTTTSTTSTSSTSSTSTSSTTTTTVVGDCAQHTSRFSCKNDPLCEWIGSRRNGFCTEAGATTTTTTTVTSSTTTTTPGDICVGLDRYTCKANSSCEWIGSRRNGFCQSINGASATTSGGIVSDTLNALKNIGNSVKLAIQAL
jgi:FtsP/CotA-like multicopper oxidase with cupredoxin domain